MIVRNFWEKMMNLMCANRMNDRMNMTIMTIDSRQLPFDIIPFAVDKPWNIPRTVQEIHKKSKYVIFSLYISV